MWDYLKIFSTIYPLIEESSILETPQRNPISYTLSSPIGTFVIRSKEYLYTVYLYKVFFSYGDPIFCRPGHRNVI